MALEQYDKVVRLWQSWKVQTAADLNLYLESFRILFAYHSGRIENEEITYYDTREIFENGRVAGFTGNLRALFEQQNQKLCYEAIKENFSARKPLSVEMIKEIHRILASGTYDERRYLINGERPGAFKKHDCVTGINEAGPPPETVEAGLAALVDEVNGNGAASPLKAGAYLHARFEFIHPFADGNGRVGRTLLNYRLMTHNHPPLIVYDEDKQRYYNALRQYDEDEILSPLVDSLMAQTAKTWRRSLELAEGRATERRGLSDFL